MAMTYLRLDLAILHAASDLTADKTPFLRAVLLTDQASEDADELESEISSSECCPAAAARRRSLFFRRLFVFRASFLSYSVSTGCFKASEAKRAGSTIKLMVDWRLSLLRFLGSRLLAKQQQPTPSSYSLPPCNKGMAIPGDCPLDLSLLAFEHGRTTNDQTVMASEANGRT